MGSFYHDREWIQGWGITSLIFAPKNTSMTTRFWYLFNHIIIHIRDGKLLAWPISAPHLDSLLHPFGDPNTAFPIGPLEPLQLHQHPFPVAQIPVTMP